MSLLNDHNDYFESCLYGSMQIFDKDNIDGEYNSLEDCIKEHIVKLRYDIFGHAKRCLQYRCSNNHDCINKVRYRKIHFDSHLFDKFKRDGDYTIIDISVLSTIKNLTLEFISLSITADGNAINILMNGVPIDNKKLIEAHNARSYYNIKITDENAEPKEILIKIYDKESKILKKDNLIKRITISTVLD
jgi:hypothetical protein